MARESDLSINYDLFTKPIYTVATLPPAANSQGMHAWVSDSSKAGFTDRGFTVAGGGTYRCKVQCDGTVWKIDG